MIFIPDSEGYKISGKDGKNCYLIGMEEKLHFTDHIEVEIEQLIIKTRYFQNPFLYILLHSTIFKVSFLNTTHNGLLGVG